MFNLFCECGGKFDFSKKKIYFDILIILNLYIGIKMLFYFLYSELLDDNNPWWCPYCKKNRCATKTLSISKYPRCLIVYLKRLPFLI